MFRCTLTMLTPLALGLFFGSCQCNPVDPPPPPAPTLAGQYQGSFSRTEQDAGAVQEQRILWTFTDTEWSLRIDTLNKTDFCICESSGRYVLEDRVRLTVDRSRFWADLCEPCDSDLNPSGLFALDRSTATLRMYQSLTDEGTGMATQVEIKLLPVESP